MSAFQNLLSPGRIGSMELRNRLVMSPMETMYGTPDGLPSERTVAYFDPDGNARVLTQSVVCSLRGDLVGRMDLVCSGFREPT